MTTFNSFCDPDEVLLRFRRPEASVFSLAREFTCPSRYYRRRPGFDVVSEDHTIRKEEESEFETEENYNEKCSACVRRKERKIAHERNQESKVKPTPKDMNEKNIQMQTAGDNQKFALRINVDGFDPDDIQVKIKDGWVEVDAKHEEKNESSGTSSFRQLHRRATLPEHVDPNLVTSFLSKDGYLSIEASPPEPALASQQDDSAKAELATRDSANSEVDAKDQLLPTATTEITNAENSSAVQSPAA